MNRIVAFKTSLLNMGRDLTTAPYDYFELVSLQHKVFVTFLHASLEVISISLGDVLSMRMITS